ncbi:MAG: hypothetical protein HPY90_04500 [Syntrophothermus sp.]|uniref:hypothetical protein n=1 Tax=Syntrophothermus sp. TaxID=2736299 RepID=UPI002579A585|nr:hypothetical protein [Syntrophothermus sp.]NSW82527.1 hypothetical protein [Syntrophothermus sp.]
MSEFEAVMRTLLQGLKANVLANTVSATHSDMLEIAELPVLILFLPDAARSRLDDANVPVQVKDETAGTVRVFDPAPTYDLAFDFEVVAETTTGVLEIGEKMAAYLEANPYLTVNSKEYPVRVVEPMGRPGAVEPANLRRASGSFVVESVEVDTGKFQDGKLARQFEAVYENQTTGGTDQATWSLKK